MLSKQDSQGGTPLEWGLGQSPKETPNEYPGAPPQPPLKGLSPLRIPISFLLDWDGVLAETRLDFAPLRQKYFGGQRVPLLETAAELSAPLRAEVEAEIYRIEMEGAERAKAVDGAKDLIEWLTEARRPWAVVSRNCRESILLAAERCGIVLPPVVMSREDPYVKPAGEALALAAERIGAKLADCVMVGDFVYDLQAAQNAGIPFVLVKAAGADWEKGADFAYATVVDFVEELRRC